MGKDQEIYNDLEELLENDNTDTSSIREVSQNSEEEIEKQLKKELNKEEEYFTTLSETRNIWVDKQRQQLNLRFWWSTCILVILCLQILTLLIVVVFNVLYQREFDKSIGIYITGVFIEMLIIPKQISEHLFPKAEINHTSKILKMLIEKDKN